MFREKLKSNISIYLFLFSSSDRDLTYACVGIIVNMMSDPEQRPQFRDQVRKKSFDECFEYQYSNL